MTLPQSELAAVDRLAAAQDRWHSWIVAEAIRRYAATEDAPAQASPRRRVDTPRSLTALVAYPEFEPGLALVSVPHDSRK
jgi:hypothetical protein